MIFTIFHYNTPSLPIRTTLHPPIPSGTAVHTSPHHRQRGGAARKVS